MDLTTILEVDEEEKVDKEVKKTMKKKKKNFKKCKSKRNQKKNKKNKKKNMKNRKKRSHQKRNAKKTANKEKKTKKQEVVNVSKGIISMNCLMVLKFMDVKEDRPFLKKKGLEAKKQVIIRMKTALMDKMEKDIDGLFEDNAVGTDLKMKHRISKGNYE
ncbi:hypothetical protein CAEBREN_11017 [Caenorhabditis brenneri]|uniref:Uncharacterized protein n=1 Tax=Caenorhabditis brenneri TaxID=135651 RepID=G0MMN8_CAEBE|nr:hypothetical protein CAEBREN_11017 [Caenorhabditis brenneri]